MSPFLFQIDLENAKGKPSGLALCTRICSTLYSLHRLLDNCDVWRHLVSKQSPEELNISRRIVMPALCCQWDFVSSPLFAETSGVSARLIWERRQGRHIASRSRC